ncbi:Zinc finger RING-type protein [Macrophomina phaseolina MS6]|uniref:E3 ubiquitin-protein ligase listerin n=1 Tax=Macrophomina phaseolina (strain MS6) TaxID=1126212 RepID=K2SFF4_MACPH|nr:Zinc finger RING-type protein [Macrophomina phaseolina MS6]
MSKKARSQANSTRAATGAFAGGGFGFGSGASFSTFGASASPLSYLSEPPDFSSISDANTVVAFKNLSKKDSTTKAKALEDLQSTITSLEAPVEDAVLEAWVQIYPRTSIDAARRVRQLAHTVQGQIAAACGKRIAKHMPRVIGAWLAGLYDNDKSVSLAAQASFKSVFSSPEKMHNVRKAFQQQILEYCRNVIDKETPSTLSDERNTSSDDAEAKYSRVIASSIAVISSLLTELSAEELAKEQSSYEEALQDPRLWDFSSYSDPAVKRAIHRLLRTCMAKQRDALSGNLSIISKSYLANALHSDQTGSAYEFSETLVALTRLFPTVWTEHYTSKKTPVTKRLRQFLKRGSQSGPREYWNNVSNLISSLPKEVLPSDSAEAIEILNAVRSGIISKEEPRSNLGAAYTAYFNITATLSAAFPEEEQQRLVGEMVLPLVHQYIKPSQETATWAVPAPHATNLIGQALSISVVPLVLEAQWEQITIALIEDMKTSLPAQSKDYGTSQTQVSEEGQRWAAVASKLLEKGSPQAVRERIASSSSKVLGEAIELLKSRNGKPYGAAGIVEAMLKSFKPFLFEDDECTKLLDSFITNDLPSLFLSPASPKLASILRFYSDRPGYEDVWKATLKSCVEESDPQAKFTALAQLLSSVDAESQIATSNPELQAFILERFRLSIQGSADWSFPNQLLKQQSVLSDDTVDEVLSDLTQSLSISGNTQNALQGLSSIVQQNPNLVKKFVPTPGGSALLQKLVSFTENPNDEIAEHASNLENRIKSSLSDSSSKSALHGSIFDVISRGLVEAAADSVSPSTLVELAKDLVNDADTEGPESLQNLLPTFDAWNAALKPFLDVPPHTTFAITNPLGGGVYLVEQDRQPADVSRDSEGFSPALRMAAYTARLLTKYSILDKLPKEKMTQLYKQLLLTVQLTNDNVSRATANDIFNIYTAHSENDVVEVVADIQALLADWVSKSGTWWAGDSKSDFSFMLEALENLRESAKGLSSEAFYNARAYACATSELIEAHGWPSKQTGNMEESLKEIRKSKDTLLIAAFLYGHSTPLASHGSASRMCNELIAQLTGHNITQDTQGGLRQLTLLNIIVANQDGISDTIAKQRLIFFVKHLSEWLELQDDEAIQLNVRAEVYRAFSLLLPIMRDIYGEHWENILNSLTAFWSSVETFKDQELGYEKVIPCIHASLKLYATLKVLQADEDPNEDLVEAWKSSQPAVSKGLIELLKQSEGLDDYNHQPLKIVNELLSRHIGSISVTQLENTEELFPLLVTESSSVQQAAFEILHKQIPAAQEEISINTALEKTTAQLPDELLSLILEPPSKKVIGDWDFSRTMPLSLRGYLFSWMLVFDHFTNSSYKVKTDYIEHLQKEGHVPQLLEFLAEFLGHTKGKPADISKIDVAHYDPHASDTPLADARYLAAHLFFLTLQHLPSLAKSWWIDCKSRQTVLAVESWTERFISPPIITAALAAVSDWANSADNAASDEALTIKVNPKGKEITAGYEVDEQFMTIVVRLPPTYPLASVAVEGLNRVAVSEQKWQAWLRNCQGVVTFSNGNLVDGLVSWRRNVVGALKGQTECAICYSIISADKQLPSKRCSTCKNLFHTSCLYKWFKSSNASSCPLCRNPFNYG